MAAVARTGQVPLRHFFEHRTLTDIAMFIIGGVILALVVVGSALTLIRGK